MRAKVLIIDDEPAICVSLKNALRKGYEVSYVTNRADAVRQIGTTHFDVVLLDLCLAEDDGIDVLKEIKAIDGTAAVIMMTAYGSIQSSVQAMRYGAYNYLTKPVDVEELRIFIEQAISVQALNDRVQYLAAELESRYQYGDMIGKSEVMQRVYQRVEKVKDADCGVLLSGESGTGKELVARAIHYMGKRKQAKFVVVNCAAIPEGLLEEEFFGHKKGSFTGALADKKGKVELADKGTLFLDEIGDMPLSLQGKLLRVLQQKEYSPIGSNETYSVDIRLIAATNKNLLEMIEQGKFRQDLFYRINVVEIMLPPLRERREDITLLVQAFLNEFNQAQGKSVALVHSGAMRKLMTYSYPGNVRELRNMIEYACIMCDGNEILEEDLPQGLDPAQHSPEGAIGAPVTLAEIEKQAILDSIERNNGHQKRTAEELGISERSLRNKLAEYGWRREKG